MALEEAKEQKEHRKARCEKCYDYLWINFGCRFPTIFNGFSVSLRHACD
jgi:hypothetical protein